MQGKRNREALTLAEEALALLEISGNRLTPVVLKCLRLATLLDNTEAVDWLRLELRGYREGVSTDGKWEPYATWSGRIASVDQQIGQKRYWIAPIEEIEAELDIALSDLDSLRLTPVTVQETGSEQQYRYLPTVGEKIINSITAKRLEKANLIRRWKQIVACLRGALQDWLAQTAVELRYGTILEDTFDRVRTRFDEFLSRHAPAVGERLAAAYDRSYSDDPEEWSQALTSCRRALKALADAVYPPSPTPIDDHPLTDENYRSRLIQFAKEHLQSDSKGKVIEAEVDYVVNRVESLDKLANKGVHGDVDEVDLELAIVHTYLLAGELVSLLPRETIEAVGPMAPDAQSEPEATATTTRQRTRVKRT